MTAPSHEAARIALSQQARFVTRACLPFATGCADPFQVLDLSLSHAACGMPDAMDRRDFLKDAAQFLLVLPFGTFLIRCKSDSKGSSGPPGPDDTPPAIAPKVVGTNVVFASSLTNDHSHSFTVPISAFATPPLGGLTGLTTEGQGHQHTLTIDQDALNRANDGDYVKVESGKAADDHTHWFTIVKMG